MAVDHASSIQAVALRVTKLDATGAPISGNKSSWITQQFIKFSFTPEYESGEDIVVKGADGSLCVTYKTKDVLKRVNCEMEICSPEPEFMALVNGGAALTPPPGTGDVTGYESQQVGEVTTPNGLGIEVWSRAIVAGKPAAVNPYWMWVYPYTQWQATGDRVAENGLMANVFQGWGVGNANFGAGPSGAYPFPASTVKPYTYARVASVPSILNGWLA